MTKMQQDKYFGISPRIARWKIDIPFENWLSHRADNSKFWKKIYVVFYRIVDNEYYKRGIIIIKSLIEANREELVGYKEGYIIDDMVYCLHRFGFSFQDYCLYGLVNRTLQCRKSFVSDKLRYHYCDILNAPFVEQLMTDKYACYQHYKRFFKRDVLGCYGESDKASFLSFIKIHPRFIIKPMKEHSGHGVRIVSTDKIDTDVFYADMIDKGAFIVEELIEQGKELAIVHPQSVNSLRVVTFVIGNQVNIIGVTWRIGVGGSIMDNAGAGGIYASIDFEHGFVQTDAINYNGEHFNIHPDTQVQLVGYILPKWEEALALIREMALTVKGATLVSWDIAYSIKGWLMVEANDNGDWGIMQSNKKEGKKEILYSYMDQFLKKN